MIHYALHFSSRPLSFQYEVGGTGGTHGVVHGQLVTVSLIRWTMLESIVFVPCRIKQLLLDP